MIKSITTTYFSPEVHYSIAHWSVRPLQPYLIPLNQLVYHDFSYTFAGFVSLCQIHSLPFLYFLSSINKRQLQQHQPRRSLLTVYSHSFTSSIIVAIRKTSQNSLPTYIFSPSCRFFK